MRKYFNELLQYIKSKDEYHYQEIMTNIEGIDSSYFLQVESLLQKFATLMQKLGKTYFYGIDCYLKKNEDLFEEFLEFSRTGKYQYSSFEEVKSRVYDNPMIMEYHTIGLLLLQILRSTNYKKLNFFINTIELKSANITKYLEVGGGHGLYLNEAYEKMVGGKCNYYYLDISKKSMEIAQHFLGVKEVNFILDDIFNFSEHEDFDFITLGEVLEHVEEPLKLLLKLHNLLSPGGYLFLTVPMNMPAIDHIYLFRDASQIKLIINDAGFEIIEENIFLEFENQRNDSKLKLASSFAALCKKR